MIHLSQIYLEFNVRNILREWDSQTALENMPEAL